MPDLNELAVELFDRECVLLRQLDEVQRLENVLQPYRQAVQLYGPAVRMMELYGPAMRMIELARPHLELVASINARLVPNQASTFVSPFDGLADSLSPPPMMDFDAALKQAVREVLDERFEVEPRRTQIGFNTEAEGHE